ncbi:porin family protein [Psychrobacter lutiphocae]|nr:porin family protein [Psychrobacter lutiphocae]
MTAQPYIGAKIGQYDLDKAKDEAFSYGIYGGVKFTPIFGVEAEYMTTNKEDFTKNMLDRRKYEADVYGLYGTAEYLFPGSNMYAKGRLGVANNRIKMQQRLYNGQVVRGKNKQSDTNIAGGVGLGYNFTPNAAVELAYDWYPKVKDIDYNGRDLKAEGLTLGANFKF